MLEAGTIEPKQNDLVQNRIFKIYHNLDIIIQEYKPESLVLEKLYSHTKHPMTSSLLGQVRGVVCLICAQQKIELIELSVKRVRKAITGNGNATKQQVRRLIAHHFDLKETVLKLDASDAAALALGYLQMHMLDSRLKI